MAVMIGSIRLRMAVRITSEARLLSRMRKRDYESPSVLLVGIG